MIEEKNTLNGNVCGIGPGVEWGVDIRKEEGRPFL